MVRRRAIQGATKTSGETASTMTVNNKRVFYVK